VTTTEPITTPTWGARVRRIALPVVLGAFEVVGSFGAANGQPDRRAPDWFMVVLLLIGALSLYWLRTHPVPVLWATVVSTLVYMLMEYPWGPVIFSFVIAAFSVIRLGHRLQGWIGIATLYIGHVGGRMLLGLTEQGVYQILLVGTCFVVLGFTAELFRAQRERATAAARTRREAELRKAGEERLRIAQELHDVVAHHISLINVQASTALHLVDRQPEQAGPALSAIKDAS
jgi:signal transduction histidine kinase